MDKIWIGTSGRHADYTVHAAFTTEEKAVKWCDLMDRVGLFFDSEYEAVALDPEYDVNMPPGHMPWYVVMTKDGLVVAVEKQRVFSPDALSDAELTATRIIEKWWDDENGKRTAHRVMAAEMYATDAQHAIKIANERRAVIIAADRWQIGDIEL